MTEQEFTRFLETHSEYLFDLKKFQNVLNDLFPAEGRMNILLSNLLRMKLPQELEELDVITDAVFYRFQNKLISLYGTDKTIAAQALRLWLVCYGGQILHREVRCKAFGHEGPAADPFAGEEDEKEMNRRGLLDHGKTFKDCPFKLVVPELTVLTGSALAEFAIMNSGTSDETVVLESVSLSDTLNNHYNYLCCTDSQTLYSKKKGAVRQKLTVSIPIDGKKCYVPGAQLVLSFFVSDVRKYTVEYRFVKTKAELRSVVSDDLTAEDLSRLKTIMEVSAGQNSAGGAGAGSLRNAAGTAKTNASSTGTSVPPISVIVPPEVEEYKKALLREKAFLQNGGGQKHIVSNGKLVNSRNGRYTYSFEAETELYLTDDALITLVVGTQRSAGNVLSCEGFQLVVTVDGDFGSAIPRAAVLVEPWKLLEALVEKLDRLHSGHQIAMELIQEGPALAGKGPSVLPKGQAAAIGAAQNQRITVVWGPPGTGKTYTMAQIAKGALQNGKTVLIVSHSNVSVDGVILQTAKTLRIEGMGALLEAGRVLRYGYVRDEKLLQDREAVAYNYALSHRPDLENKINYYKQLIIDLKRTEQFHTPKGEQAEKELKDLRAKVRSEEKEYTKKAVLVATTISKVTVDPVFDGRLFDVVMFDEISMAYVPQIFCAAMNAREKMVLVGDFRQLAPIVQSDAKKVLGPDLFAYLGISVGMKVIPHPWLVMLDEQRRMHPEISAFPSRYVYGGLLRDHPSVIHSRDSIAAEDPLPGKAVTLVNLAGTYSAAMKNSDNSRFSILSAILAFSTALLAEEGGDKNVGIITPYAAQTRLLRAMIQDHRKEGVETNVACSTVHQFQGSERNVIVFDAVESYPASKVGWLMGKDLGSVARLVNVAVTRARGKLIVFANAAFWENKFGGSSHILYRLIRYLKDEEKVVGVKEKTLKPYLEDLPSTRNIRYYSETAKALDAFRADIKRARQKIVISIPDGELDPETQGEILDALLEAKQRGVTILCKSAGYQDLPDEWKKITWSSENAVFPLITVDDRTSWYGLPISRGLFTDGVNGVKTVCRTVYRIRGEHTLEIIKTFAETETKVVDGVKKALTEKTGALPAEPFSPIGSMANASGLDLYIRNSVGCSLCKSPMRPDKGKSGKIYLRCTSSACKGTKLLDPYIVNGYLGLFGVTCPEHHCGLYAGVSKYGLYVKCDCGHFLKPEQILSL